MPQITPPPIRLLLTANADYLPQCRTLLTSFVFNNPGESLVVYFLHSDVPEEMLRKFHGFCQQLNIAFQPIRIVDDPFKNAPTMKRYPAEMYYRLLASRYLPKEAERALYLDPDMLVINSVRPLWEMDMQGNLFAAAAHNGSIGITKPFNKLRLGMKHSYFNSGVLLIDLCQAREEIFPQHISSYIEENRNTLLLPDQDVLNALYGRRIIEIDDAIWNYDAHDYKSYFLRSSGEINTKWVMKNTAILHFCGPAKPWKKSYPYRFGTLYLHYMNLMNKIYLGAGGE